MSNFTYRFKILEYTVIDGDSIKATLDLGLGITTYEIIRLSGVDAAEIRTKNLIEKEAGINAKNWLIEQMDAAELLVLESNEFNRGQYGRLIASVIADGVDLNKQIILEGYAKAYKK
jgi:endonuclease YncB( thermonuclease family)